MSELINIRSFDTETYLFVPGLQAPPYVCGSTARVHDNKTIGELITYESVYQRFAAVLETNAIVSYANAAYDLCVMMAKHPNLKWAIFKALREGRVHDVLIAESLHGIANGTLGLDPRTGGELRSPSTGKVSKRYSLELVTAINLGRTDAKSKDHFRKSYALLEGIPVERWPDIAREYPVADAENTLDVAIVQRLGKPAQHAWGDSGLCEHCGMSIPFGEIPPCLAGKRGEPHQNLGNLPAQVEADFALKLGAAWGLRTDRERVEKLSAEVEVKHAVAVERFQKKGWIREDGTEDQRAVKQDIARAYGASASCKRCGGSGKVKSVKVEECRGEKVKGRYQGCRHNVDSYCTTCNNTGKIEKLGSEINCKNVFDEAGVLTQEGCDGTGFELSDLPMLPRTEKLGVGTDRDSLMESGDEELAAFGDNEFSKSISTYVPYLRTGIDRPLSYNPNVLVATGRCSYESSPVHQFPRGGGERECIRARGEWCGSPTEYVLGSTDYEAGELCTLASFNYYLFGYSQMRDTINASGKPGILHSDLAAEVLGLSLDEFLVRLKAKDKQAGDFRQASKAIGFGRPGGMGDAKLVLTYRRKNAGFTVCEGGPARNAQGDEGYWGIRFCTLVGEAKACSTTKVIEWKNRPCPPTCKACIEIVENVFNPAYFRRYHEVKDMFKWVSKKIENKEPAPCVVWDAEANAVKMVRVRKCEEFPAFCNNGFQSMLSDIGKDAFVTATRECYLGVKDDGSSSPLAGSRLPLYLHDEPLSELIANTAHLSGPRIAEIMMESGRKLAPFVTWRAETALAQFWNKSMEPVYVDGKLVPWQPARKAA